MKKIFWGYDPREVNESIEFLESQNESLNAKIANLNLEILSKNEQLSAKTEGATTLSAEEKNELTALRTKTDNLNSENSRLQNECRNMLSKIEALESEKPEVILGEASSEVTAAEIEAVKAEILAAKAEAEAARLEAEEAKAEVLAAKEETEIAKAEAEAVREQIEAEPQIVKVVRAENMSQVGELFQSVYSNISNVKQDATESMKKFILDYVSQLEASNKKLRETVFEINGVRDDVRNTFIDGVEEILEKFEALTFESSNMESKFGSVDKIKEELFFKVGTIVGPIDAETGEPISAAAEAAEIKEENSLPPLLVKALNEKKNKGDVRKFFDDKSVIKNVSNDAKVR